VKCVNTDSIHIICSTNCTRCTITNQDESPLDADVTAASLADDLSTCEPYTSEKLSRLRSGYSLLSAPSVVVKFNFNSPQVCNLFTFFAALHRIFTIRFYMISSVALGEQVFFYLVKYSIAVMITHSVVCLSVDVGRVLMKHVKLMIFLVTLL